MSRKVVPTPTSGGGGSNHPAAGFRRVQGSRQATKAWNQAQIRGHAGSHGNVTGKTVNGSAKHRGVVSAK